MTNARLQLVFLGQLIDGEDGAGRTRSEIVGAPIATEHQEELVLWHDLDADEAQRVASRVEHLERSAPSSDRSMFDLDADQAVTTTRPSQPDPEPTWTPFPVLEAPAEEPPRKAPLTEPTRLKPIRTKPTGSGTQREINCPNCGERQTMRVLCRGCASFLEVALKAKTERDIESIARLRSGGLFAKLGF